MDQGQERDWRAVFNDVFGATVSPGDAAIFVEVYGDDYPVELAPHSFITRSRLRVMQDDLALRPGSVLVDVGCGRGGPGLWLAGQTGARLMGVDIADAAVDAARANAARLGVAGATFQQGTFEATGLSDATADAVMSVDALLFTPSKADALRELRRIVRPGGLLAMTSWDYHRQPVGRPPQVTDHRPLLAEARFETLRYDEIEGWREREARVMALELERIEELAAEDGMPVDEARASLEEEAATAAAMSRHVYLVACAV